MKLRKIAALRIAIYIFLLHMLSPPFAHPSEGISGSISFDEQSLKRSQLDIYVVTILDVKNQVTTNANPPTGQMIIDEVLRGNNRNITGINYRFEMVPKQVVGDFQDGSKPKEEWHSRTLIGPTVGERYIVFVYKWDETPDMVVSCQ